MSDYMKKFIYMFSTLILCFAFMSNVKADGSRYCSYKNSYIFRPSGNYVQSINFIDDGSGKVLVKVNYNLVINGGQNKSMTTTHYNTNLTLADLEQCPDKVCNMTYSIFNGGDPNGRFDKVDSCSFGADLENYSGGTVAKDSLAFDFIGETGQVDFKYSSWLTGCFEKIGIIKLFSIAYDLTKIATPIIMVLFATIDLAKAAASSDDSQIKKAQKHCFKRIIAGVLVFLVLVCVEFFVKLVPDSDGAMQCIKNLF